MLIQKRRHFFRENDSETFYTIKDAQALDSYNFKNVKLIKIDGEGHEKHI